jgi:sugar phosphate isomerase/epimerase
MRPLAPKPRYSVILGNLGNTCDRFLPTGYKDRLPLSAMIRQAASIPGIQGLELVGSWDITEENAATVRRLLLRHGLACVSIIPDLFSRKQWGRGSLAAKDASVRRAALAEIRSVARIARTMGCGLINLWLGQDGYDYPLQSDYRAERAALIEGLNRVASEHPDLRFALEYKMMEPRTHCFLARAADTLLVARDTGCANVGVCIDTGHALMAHENLAEAAVLLQSGEPRLFHVHFNDNYRGWDDDMIVGSVHFVEYLEFLFWLRETRYAGWHSMDQYPYREDGRRAVAESVAFLRDVDRLLTPASMAELRTIIAAGDATRSARWVRQRVFGRRAHPSAS